MGDGSRKRARGRPAVIVLLAAAALLALTAPAALAAADGSYDHGGATCADCHSGAVTNAVCTACHAGFQVRTAIPAQTCWGCHEPGQDMATAQTDAGCVATGCHAPKPAGTGTHYGSASATCTTCHGTTGAGSAHHDAVNTITKTTATLKLSSLTIRLGKTVTASGKVTPVRAGTVLVTIQRKVGTKWVKAVAKARTMTATGTYSYKYKPLKRGAYRVQTKTTAKVPYSSVKTAWKAFRVK